MRCGIWIVVCSFMLVLLLAPAHDAFAAAEKKRVLVLYAEGKDLPAHELVDRGIRSAVKSSQTFAVDLFIEYLNLSRFKDPRYGEILARFLGDKYAGTRPDLIITVSAPALDFVMKYGRDLFPGTPVVACTVFEYQLRALEQADLRRRVTGVAFTVALDDIIRVARTLKPGTKRIATVAGASESDQLYLTYFRHAVRKYEPEIEVMELVGLPMPELLERVRTLPPQSLVLYSTVFVDGTGQPFLPRDALSMVARAANAPVFGGWDSYLGHGIVGGRLLSLEAEGKKAMELAFRILAGESPADIPITGEGTHASLFDWRELQRWGISEQALPPGSLVQFKPPSVWDDHRGLILGGGFFLIIEALLILALGVNLHQRKRAEETLRQSQQEYRELAGRLLTAQETERRRLARDLHDDLSQRLAAVAIEAGILEQDSPSLPQAAAATMRKIREEMANLSGSVHDISRRLHPSILEDLGLAEAIRSECDSFARREPTITVQFEARECPPRPPLSLSLCLYRVTQESLRNIVKHARATRIEVALTGGNGMLHLMVKDNGRGFDPLHRGRGLGLSSMRERVRLIQGELSIQSQIGQGTIVEVHAPLPDGTEGRADGAVESP